MFFTDKVIFRHISAKNVPVSLSLLKVCDFSSGKMCEKYFGFPPAADAGLVGCGECGHAVAADPHPQLFSWRVHQPQPQVGPPAYDALHVRGFFKCSSTQASVCSQGSAFPAPFACWSSASRHFCPASMSSACPVCSAASSSTGGPAPSAERSCRMTSRQLSPTQSSTLQIFV